MKLTLFFLLACQVLLASFVTPAIFDLERLLKSMDSKKDAAGHSDTISIPRGLLDEFSIYVDRLKSSNGKVNFDEDSALSREIKKDFDDLRLAASNDVQERGYTLEKGQVPPFECGRYGCCPDNKPATSSGKEGCAMRLCSDVHIDTCNDLREAGQLDCDRHGKTCPFSCGKCMKAAAPIRTCEINHPGSFCCWDGLPGTGPDGRRCRACVDHYRRPCQIFKGVSRGCNSNSWRIRNFMQMHCPKTCGLCS